MSAVPDAGGRDSLFWPTVWIGFLFLVGMGLTASGYVTLPPPREGLTTVRHAGRPPVHVAEIAYSHGQRSKGSYRIQRIALTVPGYGPMEVSPPLRLSVSGIGEIGPNETVTFLVAPADRLIFAAEAAGRTLLAYDETAASQRLLGRIRMVIGICICALAGFTAVMVRRHA